VKRRTFLAAGASAGAGAVLGRVVPNGAAAAATTPDAVDAGLTRRIPFAGAHQAGIVQPRQRHALFVSFDAVADDRPMLADGMRALSDRAPSVDGNPCEPVV